MGGGHILPGALRTTTDPAVDVPEACQEPFHKSIVENCILDGISGMQ